MKKLLSPLCFTAALFLTAADNRAGEPPEGKPVVDVSKLPSPSPKQGVKFVSDIKPIFDQSCIKCHGAHRPKGRLRLDSLEGVLKGGEDGKVIEPGQSAQSLLVLNIARAGDPDDYMPPPGNKAGIKKLTDEEIGLIRAWIDQGAK